MRSTTWNDPVRRLVYACEAFASKNKSPEESIMRTLRKEYDHNNTLTVNEVRLLDAFVADNEIEIDDWAPKRKVVTQAEINP